MTGKTAGTALKAAMLKEILSAYEGMRARVQEDGSVTAPDGYSVSSLYLGYYYAFLYTLKHPDNPHYLSGEALALCLRIWEHYGDARLAPNGMTEIITRDQRWIPSHGLDEWAFYYWLASYELLREHLPHDVAAVWRERLALIFERVHEEVAREDASEEFERLLHKHTVRNHLVWTIFAMYRYGQIFGMPEVMEDARGVLYRVLDAQHPIGTWFEGESLVIGYGGVTICPLSFFALYANDDKAAAAVSRSLSYFLSVKYRDLSDVLGIDVRNRYARQAGPFTAVGYCRTPEGAAYLSQWFDMMQQQQNWQKTPFSLVLGCEMFRMFPEDAAEPRHQAPLPLHTRNEELLLTIEERGGFTVSFCGMEHAVLNNKWIMERQSLLGIYAEGIGALCGGAHSVGDPAFSLFSLVRGGKVHYLHDACRLTPRGAVMTYDGFACSYEVLEQSDAALVCRFEAPDLPEAEYVNWNLPFLNLCGKTIAINGEAVPLDKAPFERQLASGDTLAIGGATIMLTAPAAFRYPVFAFVPYNLTQKQNYAEAYGMLSVRFFQRLSTFDMTVRRTAQP